jgi:hypothetical protein
LRRLRAGRLLRGDRWTLPEILCEPENTGTTHAGQQGKGNGCDDLAAAEPRASGNIALVFGVPMFRPALALHDSEAGLEVLYLGNRAADRRIGHATHSRHCARPAHCTFKDGRPCSRL